jgi:trk system potassium uptake protein TrkH
MILTGAVLLALPIASATGQAIPFVDALFTSTSAVCVTGLIVNDTPKAFSGFGQAVVMLLVQVGGLGYMTLSTAIAVFLGKRLTLQERLTLKEALNIETMEGLVSFALTVLKFTAVFELTGAAILTLRFWAEHPLPKAAYLGLFHAVSAFNNAGFSLFTTNLMHYRSDVAVNLTITSLIIFGGLGFLVLSELRRVRRWAHLSVHTRLVLVVTAALIAAGTVTIFLLERSNPASLKGLGFGEALLASYFQAVTPRTAGFNTLDISALTPATLYVIIILMYIGASPGGTGGGVKTSTFGVTILALWSTLRGKPEPVLFGRRLGGEIVARSFFICMIALLALNLVMVTLLVVEGQTLLPALFETTSAFGTVGLSMSPPGSPLSLSSSFSPAGKLIVAAMMFMGRVGPLTLAVAVVGRQVTQRVRYPEGKVLIG